MAAAPRVWVVFLFPDSSEVRTMRSPPTLGHLVRSEGGLVWKVAEVLTSGSDTYTVTVVAPSLMAKSAHLAAQRLKRAATPDPQDLAVELLQLAKDSTSPRAIRRRWRERKYYR